MRGADLDQVYEDIKPENAVKLLNQPPDEDLPGLGQFLCVACARYFIDAHTLAEHEKTKKHRMRVKELKVKPYSIAEAEWAAGMGPPDNGRN